MPMGDLVVKPEEADENLAARLGVLANPVRIAVLRALRVPRRLRDVRVGAPATDVAPERPRGAILARQTVKDHLERLVQIGAVHVRPGTDEGAGAEYVVNHQTLWAISEEFRRLAILRSASDLEVGTREKAAGSADELPDGPCLVLVKGLPEGAIYRLAADGPIGEWVIGRRRSLDVPLDFDPFVSAENSVVRRDGAKFSVEDLEGSQNGTWVNFAKLPARERRELRSGDVIGVGCSILLFRAVGNPVPRPA